MSTPTLPGESITETLVTDEIRDSVSIQVFMEALTPDEQRRFVEFAHHFAYIGFQDGLPRLGAELTPAMQERVLTKEITLFAQGAAEAVDPPALTPFEPKPRNEGE